MQQVVAHWLKFRNIGLKQCPIFGGMRNFYAESILIILASLVFFAHVNKVWYHGLVGNQILYGIKQPGHEYLIQNAITRCTH
jgi:hypothetical protein